MCTITKGEREKGGALLSTKTNAYIVTNPAPPHRRSRWIVLNFDAAMALIMWEISRKTLLSRVKNVCV